MGGSQVPFGFLLESIARFADRRRRWRRPGVGDRACDAPAGWMVEGAGGADSLSQSPT